MEKFTYYKIGNSKFSVERIDDNFYEVVKFYKGKFFGTYCFEGENAQADALRLILTHAEISEEDYNRG